MPRKSQRRSERSVTARTSNAVPPSISVPRPTVVATAVLTVARLAMRSPFVVSPATTRSSWSALAEYSPKRNASGSWKTTQL